MTWSPEGSTTDGLRMRSRQKRGRLWLYAALPILTVFVLAVSTACSADTQGSAGSVDIQLAPPSQLSAAVMSAPPVVQEAYRFAIANPELLEKLPCYCGCGNMDHMDNLDCFVQDFNPDGSVVFDYHALG